MSATPVEQAPPLPDGLRHEQAARQGLSPGRPASSSAPDLRQSLDSILQRIEAARVQTGFADDTAIELVAVSKTQDAARVAALLAAGHRRFGENRVQEAAAKFPALRAQYPDLRLHLIGGLQTNKARDAVRLADVIEVVDRPRLAEALDDAMTREGRQPELLVQVNVGQEPQKSGVRPADADVFVEACRRRFGDRLRGLMCIPPGAEDPAPYFRALAALARAHGLPVVSMGMSADFETAIRCGATRVRVGSALFGARSAAAHGTMAASTGFVGGNAG